MKMRYWLPALILIGLGVFCYSFVYGYQFTGVILCGLGIICLVFGLLNLCRRKIFSVIFSVCLCVGVIAMIATGVWIATKMSGAEDARSDYAVVLGAGVNGTEPSRSLSERIDAAERYAKAYPEAILILSGGKGDNENISEAQCMYDELTERGISAGRLIKEEQASTTQENLRYSLDLIGQRNGKIPQEITVISSEYHLLRASLIAKKLEIEMLGYPAQTSNKLYFCNMFVREIFAVWKELMQ